MNKILVAISVVTFSAGVAAHGNVDLSKGSQVEVYTVFESEANHGSTKRDESYGFETVLMDDSGYFLYAEGETGAHNFYQIGGGKYFNTTENLGTFVYGSYADGGFGEQEIRARFGADYAVGHGLTVNGRLGYDRGVKGLTWMEYQTGHGHDNHNGYGSKHDSKIARAELGFAYDLLEKFDVSFNYVTQKQLEGELNYDREDNRHYEIRVTYSETDIQPYAEFRNTTASFVADHFEEKAAQFGLSVKF
ncbi:hypothetical protein ACP3V5_09315 [Vibrio maritimus]